MKQDLIKKLTGDSYSDGNKGLLRPYGDLKINGGVGDKSEFLP